MKMLQVKQGWKNQWTHAELERSYTWHPHRDRTETVGFRKNRLHTTPIMLTQPILPLSGVGAGEGIGASVLAKIEPVRQTFWSFTVNTHTNFGNWWSRTDHSAMHPQRYRRGDGMPPEIREIVSCGIPAILQFGFEAEHTSQLHHK